MNNFDGYTAAYLADYTYFVERDGDEGWDIRIQAPGSPVYKVHHIGTVCQEPNSIVLENAQTGKLTRLTTDDATMATFRRIAIIRWALGNEELPDPDGTAAHKIVSKKLATKRRSTRVSPARKKSVTSITLHDRDFLLSLRIEPNLEVDKS
jgi:hypothetical protein